MYNGSIGKQRNTEMTTEFKSWEELSNKEQLESIFWDAYKDAHGIRPRHINVSAMTEAELEAELKTLDELIKEGIKARREDEARAVVKFCKRIEDTIKAGAADRETALRWIHEADGSNGDDDYLCYLNGLPYGFFRK
jgi:hypothetical protein